MLLPSAILLAAAALATADTIPVSVGRDGLTFDPNVIRAHEGDVIEFRFWPRNHSVVAGHFSEACRPAEDNGFFSGFFPTQPDTVNDQVFRVTVTHTNPMPIYCSQNTGQHCASGMVAVINPPTHGDSHLSLDAYTALARRAGNATSPQGGAFGGQVAPRGSDGGHSGSATETTTAQTRTRTTTRGDDDDTETTVTETETETERETDTQTREDGATTDSATTTVTDGGGGATTTGGGTTPTGTGNVAGVVAAPVAGLVAVALGALFV